MPLELYPPRKDHPNWTIRGTYLEIAVDKSSGTPKRSVARKELTKLERKIERGEWPPREVEPGKIVPTFLSAATAYLEAGGRRRYVKRLIEHFGETPLVEIDQAAINAAAVKLHPNCTSGTRNTSVYTPTAAILHHAGVKIVVERPEGAKGRVVTDWLTPEDAFAIIAAARAIDPEFAAFLTFLLYTGLRLNEALKMRWDDLRLADGRAWIRRSKGGPAGSLTLRAELAAELIRHRDALTEADIKRDRVFRFHDGGHFKHQLTRAAMAVDGLSCPANRPVGWRRPRHRLRFVTFHIFRHTFATWMRMYGGIDEIGLVATGNWKDVRSAARYAHAVASTEWQRVESLPGPDRKAG